MESANAWTTAADRPGERCFVHLAFGGFLEHARLARTLVALPLMRNLASSSGL